jgi:hypothetical protein
LSYPFVATKITKIENYIKFELVKKKFWANLQRIIKLSTQKIVIKLSKYGSGIQDPGSGEKPIPDPGSWFRGQKGTGSPIPGPDPQHC